MNGPSPLEHLPAGRVLTRADHDALMAAWAGVGYRAMTADEIAAIVGQPLPAPSIKTEFGTGRYPAPRGRRL